MLEVGCGEGELARAVADAGYVVTAIDPVAPDGEIFRRIRLEELEPDARFDAAVASASLHHLENLSENLARVSRALDDRGRVVVDEFGWDLLDEATADWYGGQRRVLAAAGREPRGPSGADWRTHHHDTHRVHEFTTLRSALDFHFEELVFEHVPYLWRYLGGEQSRELEEALIAAGAIRAIGFRFVGIPRSDVR